MKLLIVDDQEEVGAIVGRIAEQGGWECMHMTNALGIEKVIASRKIDALLMDYALDGGPDSPRNGLATVAELRRKNLGLSVLLFTGWPDSVDMAEANRLGVLSVLAKPLSIADLRQALTQAAKQCANASSPSA